MAGITRKITVNTLIKLLKKNEPFKFMRFGDGEWFAYIGAKKNIAGHHEIFPEVTEDTKDAVHNLDGNNINGLQRLSLKIDAFKFILPGHNWADADILHRASANGELRPFIKELRNQKTCIIGNKKLRELDIGYIDFIEVRDTNCYWDKDMVLDRIEKSPADVFLVCASLLAIPLIHQATRKATYIDCGSLFDPYVGDNSRGYHNKLTEEIKNKNLCKS